MIRLDYPYMLVLLPLLFIAASFGFFWMFRSARNWQNVVAPRLQGRLVLGPSLGVAMIAPICWVAAATFVVLAIAGPRIASEEEQATPSAPTVFFLFDLSRSMRVADVRPDRLDLARITALELLGQMSAGDVGLISFAGRAVTHAPPTRDHEIVADILGQIDETWPEIGGTNIAGAIRHALDEAKEWQGTLPGIVLFSDGEEHASGMSAALAKAANAGIRIMTVAFGTPSGGPVPDARSHDGWLHHHGRRVESRMHPEVLEEIASRTDGIAVIHRNPAETNARFMDFLRTLEHAEGEMIAARSGVPATHLFLIPALFLALAGLLVDVIARRR